MIKYKIFKKYLNAIDDFLFDIKTNFSNNSLSIHKARNELKIIVYNDISMVVKSFKKPNIFNKIVYSFFRNSKAKNSFSNSLKLQNFAPQPIAYIEFYKFFLLSESYFISENFEYDFTIREPLLDLNFESRDSIFRAFAKFTLNLHNNNVFHKDYSPGNILIKKTEDGFEFKIVDVNRMKFFTMSQKDRAKNFSKLWADDSVLTIIAKEYMLHHKCTPDFIQQVVYYSRKNKAIKNFKKRLKGQKIND